LISNQEVNMPQELDSRTDGTAAVFSVRDAFGVLEPLPDAGLALLETGAALRAAGE
jgi:hypothetical protein